ncbi:MAG: DUF3530 family protein [Pseudomonadota bacterium]
MTFNLDYTAAWANDIEKEKYWKNILASSVKIGQIIELKTPKISFIGIYNRQNLFKKRGAVILLHDKAGHPNWKDVIKPLRIQLSNYGWDTLSIQMPLRKKALKTKAEINEFYQLGFARINSAVAYLIAKKERVLFLIAHGSNTAIALNFAHKNQLTRVNNVKALILISSASKKLKEHPENTIEMLEKVKLPVLDIYGSNDFDVVKSTAAQRQAAAKRSANIHYLQQEIHHADHFFSNQSEILIKRIHSWMLSTSKQ